MDFYSEPKTYTYQQLLNLPKESLKDGDIFTLNDSGGALITNKINEENKYTFFLSGAVPQPSVLVKKEENGKISFLIKDKNRKTTIYGDMLTKRYNEKKEEEKRQREAPKVVPVVAVVPKKETPKPVKNGFIRVGDLKDDEENKILKPILSEIVDKDGEVTEQRYRIALELLSDDRFLTISGEDEVEKWNLLEAIEEEIEKRAQEVLKQSPPEGSQPFQNLDSDVSTNALLLKLLAPLSKDGFIETKYIDPAFFLLSDKYEDFISIKDIKDITEDNISKFVNDLQTQILNQEIVVPRLNTNASEPLKAIVSTLQDIRTNIISKQDIKVKNVELDEKDNKIPYVNVEDNLKGYIPLEFLENIDEIYYVPKPIYEAAKALKDSNFNDFDEPNKFREGPYAVFMAELIGAEILRRRFRTPTSVSQDETNDEKEQMGRDLIKSEYPKLGNPNRLVEVKTIYGEEEYVEEEYPEKECCVCHKEVGSHLIGLYKIHRIHTTVICTKCLLDKSTENLELRIPEKNLFNAVHPECYECWLKQEKEKQALSEEEKKKLKPVRRVTDYEIYRTLRREEVLLNEYQQKNNKNFYDEMIENNEKVKKTLEDELNTLYNNFHIFEKGGTSKNGKDNLKTFDTMFEKFKVFWKQLKDIAETKRFEQIQPIITLIKRCISLLTDTADLFPENISSHFTSLIDELKKDNRFLLEQYNRNVKNANNDNKRKEDIQDKLNQIANKFFLENTQTGNLDKGRKFQPLYDNVRRPLTTTLNNIAMTDKEIELLKARKIQLLWERFIEMVNKTRKFFITKTMDKKKSIKNKRNTKLTRNIGELMEQFQEQRKTFNSQKQTNILKKQQEEMLQKQANEAHKARIKKKTQEVDAMQIQIIKLGNEIQTLEDADKRKREAEEAKKEGSLYGQQKRYKEDETIDPKNFTICPYCLQGAHRPEGCMWMSHLSKVDNNISVSCTHPNNPTSNIAFQSKGMVERYGNKDIQWCIQCHCPSAKEPDGLGPHAHISKGNKDIIPHPARIRRDTRLYFDTGVKGPENTCVYAGGFGGREFIARKIGMREALRELFKRNITEKNQATTEIIALMADNAAINESIYQIKNNLINGPIQRSQLQELLGGGNITIPDLTPEDRANFGKELLESIEKWDEKRHLDEADRIGPMVEDVFHERKTIEDLIPIVFDFSKDPKIAQKQRELENLRSAQEKANRELQTIIHEKVEIPKGVLPAPVRPTHQIQGRNISVSQEVAAVAGLAITGFTRLSNQELRNLLIQTESEIKVASDEDIPILFTKIEDIRAEIEKRRPKERQGVVNLFNNRYGHYTNPGPQRGGGGSFQELINKTEIPQTIIDQSIEEIVSECPLPTSNKIPSVGGKKNKTLKTNKRKSK